jgi:hypothetical protein
MPIQKPEEVLELVAQAINSGDVDALLALYEPEACLALASLVEGVLPMVGRIGDCHGLLISFHSLERAVQYSF